MNSNRILPLICLLILSCIADEITVKAPLDLNFDKTKLSEAMRDFNVLVVFYNKPSNKKGKKIQRTIKKLHNYFNEKDLKFVQIREKNEQGYINTMDIYVGGNLQDYENAMTFKHLEEWISDIISSKAEKISKIEGIHMDNYRYFLYVSEIFHTANQDKVDNLAKLIHPIKIYYGLDEDQLAKVTGQQKVDHSIWSFREYQKQIEPIDLTLDLAELARTIRKNEFLDSYIVNEESFKLIVHMKIPSLILFTKQPEGKLTKKITKSIKYLKGVFLNHIVDFNSNSAETQFLKKFLDVKKAPAIRLLDLSKETKRYKMKKKVTKKNVLAFVDDILLNQVKPFHIQETIEGNASIHDIEKVNTEQMDNLMNNPYKNYLFVVYSGIFNKKPEMFEEIKNLQNSLKDRSILEIVAIDHDTNDVGEYYDTELPILFLKTKKDNIVEYEGEITFEHLKDFAVKHVPELKVEDISFGEDI